MRNLIMLKRITITAIFSIGLSGCALFSAAGFSSKGLPHNNVKGELISTSSNSSVNIDHSGWHNLLQKHVNEKGLVDYEGFKKDRKALDKYIKMLADNKPDNSWSIQEQLAYYINTYNANTVRLILDNYPVKSIKKIDGAWTKEFVSMGNKQISLGAIENSILRRMKEPRIHFAINCASISCPRLLNEAYTASAINEQLEYATRTFINSDKNIIKKESAQLSRIFDWYSGDFTVKGNTLGEYINQYSNVKMKNWNNISFKEYNWNLNKQ
ncbi:MULTISPECIES: DUF547 domain-containing protein [unclassified Zunongwangia]|uniref:DUF547 domain-containing protein n=1 Tax=unclassified Zunongwangia TaxID=2632541 RepID=UPI0022DE5559|nr:MULTISPECIES: DUF547 domain-containing protein [unclassified Zunongwangia]WBL22848.1 DUF547 domain-containing protein [Zunongwangia sp. HRR-M8]WBL25239.1 DUF547 domain-containing protein [Zunongwangia sp. HGR-M22]